MADVLFEIGTEEIPARFMPGLLSNIEKNALTEMSARHITFDKLQVTGTDRRLVIIINNICETTPEISEEIKGPPTNVPEQAKLGFCKKYGLDESNLVDKDNYWHGTRLIKGLSTKAQLPEIFSAVITKLHLPIAMRWGDLDFQFIRPIHWIVALWDKDIIPFHLARIDSGRYSRGHRLLRAFGRIAGDKGVEIPSASEYLAILLDNFVLVDHVARKDKIRHDLINHPEVRQGVPHIDEDLLDEVTFLNEWPTVLIDVFDQKYLELPKEILITTMQKNQKYFPIEDVHGNLLTGFMIVSNNAKNEANVLEGNKRVLVARLEDARFFFQEDLKKSLGDRVEGLKGIVYQAKIGTMYEKIERVEKLAIWLADKLKLSLSIDNVKQAAWLCKADLMTNVVFEFAELQGIMGRIYAQQEGLPAEVCEAIYEHYLPIGQDSALPQTNLGAVLALADKIDSICSCFAVGLIPSGSADPLALRRAATGVISIILANNWQIILDELVQAHGAIKQGSETQVLDFLKQRLSYLLSEGNLKTPQKIDYDIVDLIMPINEVNFALNLASLYQANRGKENFIKLVQSAVRIGRISRQDSSESAVIPELFQEQIEHVFWDLFKKTQIQVNQLLQQNNIEQILYAFYETTPVIEEYFEKILIMDKEEKVKQNRLALLKAWQSLFGQFGDWEKVVQTLTT